MITEERFKEFRTTFWPFLKGHIEERIEGNRDLLEIPTTLRGNLTQDTDDMLRGRLRELRMMIDAVENDEMLLAELKTNDEEE